MPYAGNLVDFAQFQQELVGQWENKNFHGTHAGGKENPYSYNVMPLPQVTPQPSEPHYPGYILKNFTYYETVKFNGVKEIAMPATAPNRGGRYAQNSRALFYEQQVSFAEGPNKSQVVHVENGAWLFLQSNRQIIGPYDGGNHEPGPVVPQPPDITAAKQIAVPHGNSVLALGSYGEIVHGSPTIPDALAPFPMPATISTIPYAESLPDNQNLHPDLTLNPNKPLQDAMAALHPESYIYCRVTTEPLLHGQGNVTNIPFEQRRANVVSYVAEYWLLTTGKPNKFTHLAYTQNMVMEMKINGETYRFPHVTCNVVTKT